MRTHFIAIACLAAIFSKSTLAEDWPQWRGPLGNSTSSETNLPVVWNSGTGIQWKTPLPEWGDSTPAIFGDSIFLTSNSGDKLLLLKLDRASGKVDWTREVGTGDAGRMPLRVKEASERSEQKFHELQNLASPSPVTDGKHVVAHFGNGDLACFDFAGKELWRRNLQADYGKYTIWWGHANSPLVVGDLVISACMQDSLADLQPDKPIQSYLVAHDIDTGNERWKSLRMTGANAEECDAYTTPVLAMIGGQQQVLVMGGNQLDGYDPNSGKQLWWLPGLKGNRTVTSPTVAGDFVYATRGMRGALFAVKLESLASTSPPERDFHSIAWKQEQGTPDTPCPVVWGEWLFTVTDDGIARCYNAHTGQSKWKERLKGDHKASPIAADGRVYFLNTQGMCTVVAASDRFERLAENQFDDTFIASPVVSQGRIYLRGRKALYCLGK